MCLPDAANSTRPSLEYGQALANFRFTRHGFASASPPLYILCDLKEIPRLISFVPPRILWPIFSSPPHLSNVIACAAPKNVPELAILPIAQAVGQVESARLPGSYPAL